MKKQILIIAAIVLAVCGVGAGTYCLLTGGSSDKYTQLVPKEASVVSSINLKGLAEKIGAENLTKLTKGSSLPASMKKYEEDPQKIGVDPRVPAYVFVKDDQYVGAVLKTLSQSDFEDFINNLHKEDNSIGKVEVIDGYKVSKLSNSSVIVFNSDAILFLQPVSLEGNALAKAKELFNLTKENQFANTDEFKELDSNKNDLSANLSYDFLTKMAKKYGKNLNLPDGLDVDKLKSKMTCNFNNGEILFNANVYSNDASVQKELESEAAKSSQKVKGDYLGLMDENSLIFATSYIDGSSFVEDFEKGLETDEVKNSEYGEYLEDGDVKEMIAKVENLLKDLKGECAISIGANFSSAIPVQINIASQTKSTNFLKDMDYWKSQLGELGSMKQDDAQNYTLNMMGFKVKVGVEGDNFYLTTNSAPKTMFAATPSKRIADFKSDITSGYGYGFIDIKKISPVVAMIAGGKYNDILGKLDYLAINQPSPLEASVKLTFADKDENSLKSILKMVQDK